MPLGIGSSEYYDSNIVPIFNEQVSKSKKPEESPEKLDDSSAHPDQEKDSAAKAVQEQKPVSKKEEEKQKNLEQDFEKILQLQQVTTPLEGPKLSIQEEVVSPNRERLLTAERERSETFTSIDSFAATAVGSASQISLSPAAALEIDLIAPFVQISQIPLQIKQYQLIDQEIKTLQNKCAEKEKLIEKTGKEARILKLEVATLQKQIKTLEQKKLVVVTNIGQTAAATFQQSTGSAANLISTLGHGIVSSLTVSQDSGGAGAGAVGAVSSFVMLLQELNNYQETKKTVSEKEANLKEVEKNPTKNREEIKHINKELKTLNMNLEKMRSNIVVQTATTTKNLSLTGSSTASTILDSGARVAPHVIPVLHAVTAGTAGFAGIVGVALAANSLNDNRIACLTINAQIERLQQIHDKTPHGYMKNLIALKISNLQTQREDVLAEAGRNTATLFSSGVGIAAGALAVAGLTIPPVTIAAAAIAGIGLIGYGGYKGYKKRHQLRLHAEQFLSSATTTTIKVQTHFETKKRTAAHKEAKQERETITSTTQKTTDFIQGEFEQLMAKKEVDLASQKLLGAVSEIEEFLEPSPAPEAKAKLAKEMKTIQQSIQDIEKEMRSIEKGKIVLLNVQASNQSSQIGGSMKKVDAADEKLGRLAKTKMKEQADYRQREQLLKDAATAELLGVHPKEISQIRTELEKNLKEPQLAKELQEFLEEEGGELRDPASSQDFMNWLVQPAIS